MKNIKEGFILLQSVFEIFFVFMGTMTVLACFARTVFVLKQSLDYMLQNGIMTNSVKTVILICKNEVERVDVKLETPFYIRLYRQDGFSRIGFYYNKNQHKLYRYSKNDTSSTGETYIADNIDMRYEDRFLKVSFGNSPEICLYLPDNTTED